jgi:ABC-type iron transport system FetAB ATPase subunit
VGQDTVTISQALDRVSTVGIETAPFIYFVERNHTYLRVGHKSEQVKNWFHRTQRTTIDEIEQNNQVPGI